MTEELINAPRESSVELSRIGKIETYEVLAMEIDQLEAALSTESQALAFTNFMAGVFISAGISWVSAKDLSPTATAVYAAVMISSVVLTGWFGSQWIKARAARPRLLARIRDRSARGAVATVTPISGR